MSRGVKKEIKVSHKLVPGEHLSMANDKMSLYCAILVARKGEENGGTYMPIFHVQCVLQRNAILDLAFKHCTVCFVHHMCSAFITC